MLFMVDATKGGRQRRAYRSVLPEMLEVPPDRGCADISDRCLACPLDQCLWDYPRGERIKVKRQFLESKPR
jgi:hypothetical protein